MKIEFCIQGQGVMNTDLSFGIDWECPYIPRIGETIDSSLLADYVNPNKFYGTLNEKEKADWNDCLSKGQSSDELLKEWLEDMSFAVDYICWNKHKGEFGMFIMLKPDK